MSSPLSFLRERQYIMLVAFGILLMFAFVVAPPLQDYLTLRARNSQDPVMVSWSGGTLRYSDLQRLQQSHAQTHDFLNAVAEEAQKRGGMPRSTTNLQPAQSQDDLMDMLVLADRARRSGIVISDEAVTDYLKGLSDQTMSGDDFRVLIKKTSLTAVEIYKQLKLEMAAALVNDITRGAQVITPAEVWTEHNRLHRRRSMEVLPFSVEAFRQRVQGDPSESQLARMFEEGKERFSTPDSPEIGFRILPRQQFGFVRGEFQKFLEVARTGVTEEAIEEHYKKAIEQGRFKRTTPSASTPSASTPAPTAPPAESAEEGQPPSGEPTTPAEEPPTSDAAPDATKGVEPQADGAKTEEGKAEEGKTEEKPADRQSRLSRNGTLFVGLVQDDKPADDKPADDKPADDKPADDKPADDKPADDKPADDKPADDKPADDKPADDKPADDKPADDKPADDKPADDKPADDKPADDKPADDKPADDKPADDKPADDKPADDKPADDKPADDKPADDKPAEGTPPVGLEGSPFQAESEFLTLEEVREQVIDEVAKPIAQARLDEAMKAARQAASEYRREFVRWEGTELDSDGKPSGKGERPESKVQETAEGLSLVYGETELLDQFQIADTDIGKCMRVSFAMGQVQYLTFAQEAYQDFQAPLYEPSEARAGDDMYVYWRVAKEEARIPEFSEVREQVREAWVTLEARKLAEEAAKKIAARAEERPEMPLKEVAQEHAAKVVESGEFTWLTTSMPFGPFTPPQLGAINGIDQADNDLMRSVFGMKVGETQVVANHPRNTYYVVRVVGESPMAEMREEFMLDVPMQEFQLGIQEYALEAAQQRRMQRLEDAKVKWHAYE